MPRDEHAEARRRWALLPPEAMTAQRPFLLDARRRRIFSSWPKKRAGPGDEDRLAAALASLADVTLPYWLCLDLGRRAAAGAGSWRRRRLARTLAARPRRLSRRRVVARRAQSHSVMVCHPCCQDRQCCVSPCGPLASK